MEIILWDGTNHQETSEFIDKCKNIFDNIERPVDLDFIMCEGEVRFNGKYFKTPCYIFYTIRSGVYVIKESEFRVLKEIL